MLEEYFEQAQRASEKWSDRADERSTTMTKRARSTTSLVIALSATLATTVLGADTTLELDNGATYEGQSAGGRPHGSGRMEWPDGAVYEGGWRHGAKHGAGHYTGPDGGTYIGDYADGARQGRGTYSCRTTGSIPASGAQGCRTGGGSRASRGHRTSSTAARGTADCATERAWRPQWARARGAASGGGGRSSPRRAAEQRDCR